MALSDSIRNRLKIQVFDKLGSNCTLTKLSSKTYNDYGDLETQTETSSTVKFVPYNLIEPNKTFNAFGQLNEGETDAVFSYDTTFNIDDKVVFNNETYRIRQIEDYILQGVTVAFVVRLYKESL